MCLQVKDPPAATYTASDSLSVVVALIVLGSDNYFQLSLCLLVVSTEIKGTTERVKS